MYSAFRNWCEQLLRIPPQPEPPPGDDASTRVFLAVPNYYKYLLAQWGLKTGGVVLGALFVSFFPLPRWLEWILFCGALLSQVFALALVRLDFDKRWYVVTDRSLRIREGIFEVREMTVTFANIQNISVSQGPIQRLLGICDLRVDTAGGGGGNLAEHGGHGQRENLHTAWFRGINNADEIRALIQQRLRHHKDAGLGDHDDALPPPVPASTPLLAALREVYDETRALNESLAIHSR